MNQLSLLSLILHVFGSLTRLDRILNGLEISLLRLLLLVVLRLFQMLAHRHRLILAQTIDRNKSL
jgi:chromate transport protein ChrA